MNIHFSTATIQSYENKNKSMDLFFNPIVIFESLVPFSIEQLKDIKWKIISDKIGLHYFDIQIIKNPTISNTDNKIFIEFRLNKKDVSFEFDNYSCKIVFSATIELLNQANIQVEHEVLAIVKTKWSKGLI